MIEKFQDEYRLSHWANVLFTKAGMKFISSQISSGLRRLFPYFIQNKWKIVAAVFFMIAAGTSSSLIALLLGKMTDTGFYKQEQWVVIGAPVGLVLVAVLHGGSMFMSNFLLGQVSQSMLKDLRKRLFHALLRWPSPTYQRNPTGLISSKFVFEANVLLSSAAKSCITLVRDSIQVVLLTGLLVWKNWYLALVSLIILPFVVKLLRYIARKMKAVMSACQQSAADILVRVREVYRAQRVVKLANAYAYEETRFSAINEAVRKMMVDMTKVTSLGTPTTQMICMCGVAIVLAFAMYQAHLGNLSLGEFVTFLTALLLLMPPLKNLASVNTGFVMMACAADSIFATLDESEEEDKGTRSLETCHGNFAFEHVSMTYPGMDKKALSDFNLTVNAGDCVALVGLSGAGKTTVVNMIPRFLDPTAGRIMLDGIDLREIRLPELRKHIAIVTQETLLFDDTIANNIAYGTSSASKEDILKAAQMASLTELIKSLPQGLDTRVGEAGGLLSGGEKQRIAIARAFLKNAPILILDEATSALDSRNEANIRDSLVRLMKGRTTFIVAHRLSTIKNSTHIVAMADGRIQEEGTREELLHKDGLFAELYRLQNIKAQEQSQ